MEPIYIVETLKNTQAALQKAPNTSPFELHRILTHFSEIISNELQTLQNKTEQLRSYGKPTLEQTSNTIEELQTLTLHLNQLNSALNILDEINTCQHLTGITSLNDDEKQRIDQCFCLATDPLNNQLRQLQREIENDLSCQQLQREYLLYIVSKENSPAVSVKWTAHHLAGQYLYMTEGNVDKSKEILISLAEEMYMHIEQDALRTMDMQLRSFPLEALSLLTAGQENSVNHVEHQQHQTIDPPDLLDQAETLTSLIAEPHEENKTPNHEEREGERSPEATYEDTDPSEKPSTTNDTLEPTEAMPHKEANPNTQQEIEPKEISPDEPTYQAVNPEKKFISHQQYNMLRDEHRKLEQNFNEAKQRLLAIQKEFHGDITQANKEQVTKWTQAQTAVRDLEERLRDVAEKLDKLNKAIRAGQISFQKTKQKPT